MKCPKFKAAFIASGRDFGEGDVECDKEECAWWQVGDEECAILNLAEGIADNGFWLAAILKRMPHVGQFTR